MPNGSRSFKNMKPKIASDGNGGYVWKSDVDKFQGYVVSKLENIHEELQEMKKIEKEHLKETQDRICKVEDECNANKLELAKMKQLVAIIGAGVSFVVSIASAGMTWLGGKIL